MTELAGLAGLFEPTEVPVEVPFEAPVEVPSEGPVEAPFGVPVEAPFEVPVEVPEMTGLFQPVEQSESSPWCIHVESSSCVRPYLLVWSVGEKENCHCRMTSC